MNSPRRILVVIADALLGQMLGEHLGAAGHAVTAAAPSQAPELAPSHDVVVIDAALDSGGELLRRVKARAEAVPVLLLGGSDPAAAAALPKPVRLQAVAAKVSELGRRPGPRLGPWRFDEGARTLEDEAGTRLRLTDKEAAILALLARAGGVVTRERLLAEVWGYSAAVTTHTLETHIYRLRRKLGQAKAGGDVLVTADGGYRLAGG